MKQVSLSLLATIFVCAAVPASSIASDTASNPEQVQTSEDQIFLAILNGTTDKVHRTGNSVQKFWLCEDKTCSEKELLVDFGKYKYRAKYKKVSFDEGPMTILSERRFYRRHSGADTFPSPGSEIKGKQCTSTVTFTPEKYGKYFLRLEQDLDSSKRRLRPANRSECQLFIDSGNSEPEN